jgi:type I restriction-modification system DNA methylase subunit
LLANGESLIREIQNRIQIMHAEADSKKRFPLAIDVANAVLSLLTSEDKNTSQRIIDDRLVPLPNAERQDHWFHKHPWAGDERAAFDVFEGKNAPLQGKLFWMKKRSRQHVAGGVHLTENWEDRDFTRNSDYKIGIDFFVNSSANSVLVVLSNKGNLRLVDLGEKLSNTQVEIFQKWADIRDEKSQERMHSAIWDSFKLQSVNNSFYQGISNSFTELLQELIRQGKDEEASKLFSSRLLGRVMFVWFLRNMGLINKSVGYFDVEVDSTDYYRTRLEPLFFETLNTPIEARTKRTSTDSLLGLDNVTPYLNGGLFAPQLGDWYGDSSLTFQDGFFERLYQHFSNYNFTTDESTPEYEQVAIDPEMLGRVFESLLATQVDDTGKQARKAKGTFYTPREIVAHMCKESVRSAFKAKAGDDSVLHKAIDSLLDVTDRDWSANGSNSIKWALPIERRKDFLGLLDSLTSLDPACGSGAFPIGLVNLLMRIHERVDPSLNKHKTKLKIVQNNIFGSDIEPMAVEISRLRAWLSIIVERDEGENIEPLPNLEFNFVCANSLIPLENMSFDLFNDPGFNIKLDEVRKKYYSATSPDKKAKLRKDYYKISKSDLGLAEDRRTTQLRTFDPFINTHSAEFFEPTHMFGKESFDIVIGNPPYGAKLSAADKALFKRTYRVARTENGVKGSTDTYAAFMEMGLNLLVRGGNLQFILPISVMTSDAMSQAHNLFESQCETLKFASFSVRPKPIFENATVNVAIFLAVKTETPNQEILATKLYRKNNEISVSDIVANLKYQNVAKLKMRGRYPKISDDIEVKILEKLQSAPNKLADLITEDGSPIFYRAAGGRYFKVITDYSTNSSAERSLLVDKKYAGLVGALLSSSLFFWYYQLFSDNLNLKTYEIESFPIPIEKADAQNIQTAEKLFAEYLLDIEKNSNVRKTEKYAHISEFREYKLGRSINIIDKLDDALDGLFGLTLEEISYIKGYERKFRLEDDDSEDSESPED